MDCLMILEAGGLGSRCKRGRILLLRAVLKARSEWEESIVAICTLENQRIQ